MMQERSPGGAATPRRLPGPEQIAQLDPVPGLVLVEGADRRQLPVHRRVAAVTLRRRQHDHPAVPAYRRQPKPGDELEPVTISV